MKAVPVFLAAAFLLGPANHSVPGFAAEPADLSRTLDKLAREEIEAGRAIGLTIGVARGDEILHLQGYGQADIENSVPASEKTVYRIGSITKMFTAVAILLLAEDEKLSLDDSLPKHLPDYPPEGDKVTIRHLLNHTSGIFSFTDRPVRRADKILNRKPEEVLALFQDVPLHFEPGERFRYCNSGYFLLGMIVERASGKTYEEFLEERLFKPLGLDATVYDRHLKIVPNRASGYAFWGDWKVNAPFVSMTQIFAAGALASTTGDLIKWQRALVNHDLLKPESFAQMTSPGELNGGKKSPYGFGCFVGKQGGRKVIHHGGSIPGFVAELAWYPDADVTVVILTNSSRTSPQKLAGRIAEVATATAGKTN